MKKARKPVRPRWTKDQVKYLRSHYKTDSNAAIAQQIGRDVNSVVFKAHILGLAKGAARLRAMGQENIALRWGKRGKAKAGRN